ncbi:hypothetical protein [Metabacillus endolithicus]|uniref:RsbT co-antagonist protein RsbRD N-terminal domain-containing protein n=1 Tax=Metabacillus endolithicus TaxID=1535204 RepID=A0ABW5C2R1_9BACI|nr:hypothetical protein [Metabacillus endolithicus]UPG66238.1 hypothetical protein MVE64_26390 [Metabacillus endolithicus]
METNALFYKIKKGIVTIEDYLKWSQHLLERNESSPSINAISSFSNDDNIFEIEDYFKRALEEIEIKQPSHVTSARGYIAHLAMRIIILENPSEILDLAYRIFRIVGKELLYPDDLIEWYEISEMIDILRYGDDVHLEFEKDVITKIKTEANLLLKNDKMMNIFFTKKER